MPTVLISWTLNISKKSVSLGKNKVDIIYYFNIWLTVFPSKTSKALLNVALYCQIRSYDSVLQGNKGMKRVWKFFISLWRWTVLRVMHKSSLYVPHLITKQKPKKTINRYPFVLVRIGDASKRHVIDQQHFMLFRTTDAWYTDTSQYSIFWEWWTHKSKTLFIYERGKDRISLRL